MPRSQSSTGWKYSLMLDIEQHMLLNISEDRGTNLMILQICLPNWPVGNCNGSFLRFNYNNTGPYAAFLKGGLHGGVAQTGML